MQWISHAPDRSMFLDYTAQIHGKDRDHGKSLLLLCSLIAIQVGHALPFIRFYLDNKVLM